MCFLVAWDMVCLGANHTRAKAVTELSVAQKFGGTSTAVNRVGLLQSKGLRQLRHRLSSLRRMRSVSMIFIKPICLDYTLWRRRKIWVFLLPRHFDDEAFLERCRRYSMFDPYSKKCPPFCCNPCFLCVGKFN